MSKNKDGQWKEDIKFYGWAGAAIIGSNVGLRTIGLIKDGADHTIVTLLMILSGWVFKLNSDVEQLKKERKINESLKGKKGVANGSTLLIIVIILILLYLYFKNQGQ